MKIVLVWAVLKDKLWAYPWMVAFLLVFIAYQSYQLVVGFTVGMALLTAFDIFIVWLTLHEYRAHRTRRALATPASPFHPPEATTPIMPASSWSRM